MEPTTTAAGGFALSKGLAALAGLFGGLSVSFFWQPKKLHAHGKLAAGAIVGGIAVGASFTLGGLVISWTGLDPDHVDAALGIGYLVGVLSVGIVGLLANFFEKREAKDILEVANEIKTAPIVKAIRKSTPVKRASKRSTK